MGVRKAMSEAAVFRMRALLNQPATSGQVASVRRACTRYARHLRDGSMPVRCDGDLRNQLANFRRSQQGQRELDQQVRQVLNSHGELPWSFNQYYNFARQIAKLKASDISADSLSREASVLADVWSARGLNRATLAEVCRTVFSIVFDLGAGISQPPAV